MAASTTALKAFEVHESVMLRNVLLHAELSRESRPSRKTGDIVDAASFHPLMRYAEDLE